MEIRSTKAFCEKCYRLVPFKIKDNDKLKYACCMNCGKRVYVPEVEDFNAKVMKEESREQN